ncbi:MAG: prepilin-type N-terminal cleavage/methylation domain-containing protein [Epsilonproteobacteria bacterium]|nr:prepilin-type N-terminal cleavage/methylation domain-containing protein [Campylobacterota bacterium]
MRNKAFTLVEIIITIVILGILSAGTFVSLKHLYLKVAKSKTISNLSSDSQVVVDQISALLYDRVPSSVIGYKNDGSFDSIYNLNFTFNVIEWIGVASEAQKAGYYSGFVDLNRSDKATNTIYSPNIDKISLNSVMIDKFNKTSGDLALIFAGSFDDGLLALSSDFNSSFGWHGNLHNQIQTIASINDDNITLSSTPNEIYEKYYLVDSAYAIARGADIDLNANCIKDLNKSDANTLFLFYNYRPWQNKTFCADPNGNNQDGNVTILSYDTKGFEASLINDSVKFSLTLQKHIRGSENNITISKEKIVF